MGKAKPRRKRRLRILQMILAWAVLAGGTVGLVVLLWHLLGRVVSSSDGSRADPRRPDQKADVPGLSLFFSCDLEGRLAPYACEEGSLGGVARMATLFAEWTKDHPQRVLVDVGNSTLSAHEASETINAFTFNALDKLGYDIVNCGDNEATLSLDELRALSKERKFKLISANLIRADTRAPIFPTHHIVRRRGLNIAFIGLLREEILPKHTGKGVRLMNPALALRGAINVVKGNADIIVVLGFLPPEEMHELARRHPEVNIFVGGLSPVTSAPYELAGPRANPTTLVTYLGDQGCTVAWLNAQFPKGGTPMATGRVALLDESVKSDPAFAGLIAEFSAALSGKAMPGSAQDPKMPCTSSFVGSDVCKLCHIKQFYSWQATNHAGAYVTLLQKGAHKNPDCLICHTTGYGMPGGFDPDRPDAPPGKAPEKDALKTARVPRSQDPVKGVGCESCHGGSRHHLGIALRDRFAAARTPLLRPQPSVENCIRCHTPGRPCRDPKTADPFDRNEYMDRIKHWE